MDYWKSALEQVTAYWRNASPPARILLVAVSVISLIAIISVGVWSSRPNYVALAAGLEPTEAAEIVSALNAAGIPSKMNFAGSAVQVPSSRWSEARLAAGDTLGTKTGRGGDGQLDGGMAVFEGSTMSHHRLLRSKEADLERSILKMRAVKTAELHIAQPKWTPFAREQFPTTASVVLGLRPGHVLTKSQAYAIVQMVAGSVEGLSPNSVTLTDLNGNTLSGPDSGEAAIFDRLDYQRRLEAELVAKAEAMLQKVLGDGNSVVQVTAEIDFTERTSNATKYDPTSKVKSEERIITTENKGVQENPTGPAGTASNLAVQQNQLTDSSLSSDSEEIDTKFLNAETVEHVKELSGTIKRLTVAAMVDLSSLASQNDPASNVITTADIESVIKVAVGFQANRNDEIKVLDAKLTESTAGDETEFGGVSRWELIARVARQSSLGLAAIVALLLIPYAFRKLQPVTVEIESTEGRRDEKLARLSDQIQQNPEAVSKILSSWLQHGSTNERSKAA